MRLLMIATGYLPYLFSENLCNAKLVYAFHETGIEVDVVSRLDEGPVYENEWQAPWTELRNGTHEIHYPLGSSIRRAVDVAYSGWMMGNHYEAGVRWARRAYEQALKLMKIHHYDAILTRSPTDISHVVGMKLKEKTGIKWLANWNDPADPIWPEPYKHTYSTGGQRKKEKQTAQLLKMADVNTFPSETLRDHFIEHFPFLKDKLTEVIPHIGLSDSIFKHKPIQKARILRMCHSGNLSAERNPELTFKAMRTLIDEGQKKFRLDIMGYANDYTQELIEKYGLQHYVKMIGSYTYIEAINKMQDYDVLVLIEAQLRRGIFFASKFTDYAQTGRPIFAISPIEGFAATMLSDYGGGISCDNTSEKDIMNGLKLLLSAWETGNLVKYVSDGLYKMFSPQFVIEKYTQMI